MNAIEVDDSLILRKDWLSMDEFIADLKTKPNLCGEVDINNGSQGGAEWYGTESLDDTYRLVDNGWPEGLSRMKTLYGNLKPVEGELADRHQMRFCESGDEVDVGRYVTNEPECMIDFDVVQVPAAGRIVKIIANVMASCGFSPEAIFLRGAAACMLADLVEQSGLRSEIWAVIAGGNTGSGRYDRDTAATDYRVKIKSPDQPLEMDRLAFALANASMLRRLFFKSMELLPEDTFHKHVGNGYLYPRNPKAEPGTILVDALLYGFGETLSNETVAPFVDKMLKSFMES